MWLSRSLRHDATIVVSSVPRSIPCRARKWKKKTCVYKCLQTTSARGLDSFGLCEDGSSWCLNSSTAGHCLPFLTLLKQASKNHRHCIMLLLSRCSLRKRSEKYTRLCGSAYRYIYIYWSLWIPRLCRKTGMNVRWKLERPLQITEKETRRTNAYLLPRIAEWVPLLPHIDLRTSLAQLRYVLRLQGSRLDSTCFVLQMFARFCKVHIKQDARIKA